MDYLFFVSQHLPNVQIKSLNTIFSYECGDWCSEAIPKPNMELEAETQAQISW
jgi:hypothetical protein